MLCSFPHGKSQDLVLTLKMHFFSIIIPMFMSV